MKKIYLLAIFIHTLALSINFTPFEIAMQPNHHFTQLSLQNSRWNIVKNLYDKYTTQPIDYNSLQIPKIIHHIWVGSPLPQKYIAFINSWKNKHPGWTFILWDDEAIKTLKLSNRKLYESSESFGSKSDIARLEILYQFGGLYVDTDFECLQSLEDLHYLLEFYAGIGFEKNPDIYNPLIASKAGHPILKKCIDTMNQIPVNKNNHTEVIEKTGTGLITKTFFNLIESLKNNPIVLFPPSYFYAWPHYKRKDPNPKRWLRTESVALHHWHISWMK